MDENEVAALEVKVSECCCVLMLKLQSSLIVGAVNLELELDEILLLLLKCNSVVCY